MSRTTFVLSSLAALLSTAACVDEPGTLPPLPATPSGAQLAVATSDFQTGALHSVDLSTFSVRRNIDVVDAQPVVRGFGSQVYVLDQTHGTARIYDAAQNFAAPRELSFGQAPNVPAAQTNPYDIYIDSDRKQAYVTLYGSFGSTVINGDRALGVVDLTQPQAGIARFVPLPVAAGDSDQNPDATRLSACGDTLYVLLQDLDRTTYAPVGPGRLAAVSLRDNAVRIIPLAGENPTALVVLPGCREAIVGSAGDQLSAALTGKSGIERVDLTTGQTGGLILKDSDLGGNVSTLDAVSTRDVFVDVSRRTGMRYDNDVYLVDAVTGQRGQKLLGSIKFVPALRVVGQRLVVLAPGTPDAGQLPAGLYLGPADGQSLPATPIDFGLPPVSSDLYTR